MIRSRVLPAARAAAVVATVLCSLAAAKPAVTNHEDGSEVRYPLVLLRGTVDANAAGIRVVNRSSSRPCATMQGLVREGRFLAPAELVPGKNRLSVQAGDREQEITLSYRPPTTPYVVRVIYVTDAEGNTAYQTPLADDSGDFRAKLRTAMLLLQGFTAEAFHEAGMPRQTFSPEFDADGEVVVRVMKGDLTAAEYRAMDGLTLYNRMAEERDRKLPPGEAHDLIIPAFTFFDADTGRALAHTALGGGNLALFGSGNLFTWPDSPAEIQARFMDARTIDPAKTFSDSVGRHTLWACASTTLGAALHELGHTFGLPHSAHPQDIMTRGIDRLNRFFTFSEPPHARRTEPYVFRSDEVAMWAPVSAQSLACDPFFRPDDPGDAPRDPIRVSADFDRCAVVFESDAKIAFVAARTFGDDGTTALAPVVSARPPTPRHVLQAAEIGKLTDSLNVAFAVRDAWGRSTTVRLPDLLNGPFVQRWHVAAETRPWPNSDAFPEPSAEETERLSRAALEQPATVFPEPFADLTTRFPPEACSRAVAYLARRIVVDQPRKLRILTGSDDALRLRLDGKVIREVLELRGSVPDTEVTEADLAPGEHVLLAEVYQAFGGWGLHLRLTDDRDVPLELTEAGTLVPANTGRRQAFRDAVTDQHVRQWQLAGETLPWPDPTVFPAVDTATLDRLTRDATAAELSEQPAGTGAFDLTARHPRGAETRTAAYAYRTIRCDTDRTAVFCTGSDDALRMWVNGKQVAGILALRGAVPNSDRTPVALRKGKNDVMLEISQGAGGWAFFFRVEDEAGRPLRLEADGDLKPWE